MSDEPQLTAEEYLERAIKHTQRRDDLTAIEDLTSAIHLRPDWTEAYLRRGVAYMNLNDREHAQADMDAALRLEPDNPAVQGWHKAVGSMSVTRDEAFAQLLNQIKTISDKPQMAQMFGFSLGSHAYGKSQADVDQALETLKKQNEASGYLARGAYFEAKNEREKAVEAYTEAIRLNPHLTQAYFQRAGTYGGFGHFKEAIEDYARVIELYVEQDEHPYNIATAYQSRGTLRGYTGDLDGAVADLTEAVKLRSDNAEAYFHRGTFLEENGEFEAAIADYTNVIRYTDAIDDLDRKPVSHLNRGRLREDLGDLQGAIADWQEYLALGGGEKFNDRAEVEGWIEEIKTKLEQNK